MMKTRLQSILLCAVSMWSLVWGAGTVQQPIPSSRETIWRKAQDKAKDTVVQLFVQCGKFNWQQPFKAPETKKSYGSGFFIDDQGHIISNFHVIEEAYGIKIQIPSVGKEQFDVEVVGVCPDRDLALLKLTPEALEKVRTRLGTIPFLVLGNSDEIVRTQEILALGYPLGQERLKSTNGIVSGREIVWGESYIQITAPLNPGNSGGPSLNTNGQVIGINSARIPVAQNIGYIIPINDVKSAIKDLHRVKLLRTPILGGEYNLGTEQMTDYLKNPHPGGLYIARVFPRTLFEQVGVQDGDVIYSINNHRLDVYGETNVEWSEDKVPVVALLNRFILGQDVDLEVYRKGERKEFHFKYHHLAKLPIRRLYPLFEPIDFEIIGGMVIMPLSLNHIECFDDIDYNVTKNLLKYEKRENQYEPKLIVSYVFPTSQTQESRCICMGDIISEINGVKVTNLKDLRTILRNNLLGVTTNTMVTCKTEDKKFMVLSLERVLADEDRLSRRYMYKTTKLSRELRVMWANRYTRERRQE